VISSPGKGTTFTIHLPFEAAGEKKLKNLSFDRKL
jgi:hypothetical protein